MTLLTLKSTDVRNGNLVHISTFQLLMVCFITLVVLISGKLNIRLSVAIDTPAHRQRCCLSSYFHSSTVP